MNLRGGKNFDFQNYHIIISKVQFSTKKIRQTKNQEHTANSTEQNKLTETIPEETYTLELLEQDFIKTVLNMPK